MIGPIRFGRISRKMMRGFEAPSERDASTKSFSLIESVNPRTMRAMYDQEKKAITPITIPSPGLISPLRHPWTFVLQAAVMLIAIRSEGIASITSAIRDSVVSTQRPKKPATRPTTRPISTAMPDATTPTISEVRAPYIVRTKRSRPAPSAPNQNCAFGPFGRPNESSIVSVYAVVFEWPVAHWASGPPAIAMKTRRRTMHAANSAALSSLKRSQKRREALLAARTGAAASLGFNGIAVIELVPAVFLQEQAWFESI